MLSSSANTITTIVTAADGLTTQTYIITVARVQPPLNIPYASSAIVNPIDKVQFAYDGIAVHQGISPNGDGVNDYLVIDGIAAYPDNKLMIINRSGTTIFEAKGYDNTKKVFDGHSNKNGQMQLPGTYFYTLDYSSGGVTKHKTGFIVLKY
jgi:gliding motility-associated-like protein